MFPFYNLYKWQLSKFFWPGNLRQPWASGASKCCSKTNYVVVSVNYQLPGAVPLNGFPASCNPDNTGCDDSFRTKIVRGHTLYERAIYYFGLTTLKVVAHR